MGLRKCDSLGLKSNTGYIIEQVTTVSIKASIDLGLSVENVLNAVQNFSS